MNEDRTSKADELDGDEKVHAKALEIFDLCVANEAANRIEFKDDLRFGRLGDQWLKADRDARKLDGRPCLTDNLMPAFIRQVVNDARQNKPGITVHPADDVGDPETAEVIEGLIRNIEVSSSADIAYDTAIDFAASAGWGYFRVDTEYCHDDTFEQDIVIVPVEDPLTVYGDPFEIGADSSKWNHAFVMSTMSRDAFEAKYKAKDKVDWNAGTYSRLPAGWADGEMVTVAEYWMREPTNRQIVALSDGRIVDMTVYTKEREAFDGEGLTVVGEPRTVDSFKVTQYTMSGAEVLETTSWAGKYIPIIPVYGEDLIVDGKRHLRSMIRDAKDAQRRRNFNISNVAELVALSPKTPFVGKKGAFKTDQARWETANSQTHAYLEYDGDVPPARQPFAGVPAGEMQQALMATDDMKAIMGLHDASLGAKSNETSGIAINARKLEGEVSTFNFTDNLTRSIRHLGRVIIDMIPSVYSVARVIRTMGQDGKPKKVPVNQERGVGDNGGPPMGGEEPTQTEGLGIFDLTSGKYDLVVKAGPSFTTRREESAAQMMELIKALPAVAPLVGDLLAQNLDWPGADDIADRLKMLLPPEIKAKLEAKENGGKVDPNAPPAQPPGLSKEAQQAHQMLQQATQAAQKFGQEAKSAKLEVETLKANRDADNRKLEIAMFEAQTHRMLAEAKIAADKEAAERTDNQDAYSFHRDEKQDAYSQQRDATQDERTDREEARTAEQDFAATPD